MQVDRAARKVELRPVAHPATCRRPSLGLQLESSGSIYHLLDNRNAAMAGSGSANSRILPTDLNLDPGHSEGTREELW